MESQTCCEVVFLIIMLKQAFFVIIPINYDISIMSLVIQFLNFG